MGKNSLCEKLAKIVGDDRVSDQDFARLAVSVESTAIGISFLSPFSDMFKLPEVVVKPQTTEEVVEIVKLANEIRVPIVVKGGGAGASLGTLSSKRGILIDMTDMESIVEIDEPSMAVRVQSGVTWGKLRHELGKLGLRPGPLGPHGTWGSTIGGALSYDSCCVDSHQYGQLSEDLLTLQVVLPTGEVIETGSQTNPKSLFYHRYCNGPDLAGLFLGASGSLGIVTEAAIRVYPKEQFTAHATFGFERLADSCRAMHEISRVGYDHDFWMLCGRHTVELSYPEPLDKTDSVLALYTAGYDEETIAVHAGMWSATVGKWKAKELDPSFADKFASDYSGFETAAGQSLGWGIVVIMPVLRIPEVHLQVEKFLKENEEVMMGDPGKKLWSVTGSGGVKHPMCNYGYGFTADRSDSKIRRQAFEVLKEIQKNAVQYGAAFYDLGRLPVVNYIWTVAEPTYTLLKTLKKTLDPNHIMNPGSLML